MRVHPLTLLIRECKAEILWRAREAEVGEEAGEVGVVAWGEGAHRQVEAYWECRMRERGGVEAGVVARFEEYGFKVTGAGEEVRGCEASETGADDCDSFWAQGGGHGCGWVRR